jgi:YYY domain-containing protein
MRTHISGTPIVLEAHTEAYRWGGRVATYTGLPTLLGWTWHETQQRSVAQVGPVLASRQALVAQLYNTTAQDEALRLLQLYGVEYVYVGQLERALYDPAGLAKFEALASTGRIRMVYAGGETRIYQIPRADHPPAVLTTSLPVRAPTLPRTNDLMLDVPVDQLPQVNEYAWNPLASSQPVAVLLWLLAGYALLALGLPIAALVFGGDQGGAAGTGWARLIGLLVLGYAVWMPVSMRLWHYDRWGLLLGVLLVLALDASVLIARGQRVRRALSDERQVLHGAGPLVAGRRLLAVGLHDLWDALKARRRRALIEEALFLGAFALMLALRALNPDLWQPFWGGEKPFEFGLLNAILRSPVMPPYSPFFSDGILNYYYYGLFLVSLPVKATGIAPAVAFNLIVPLVFALTVVGVFNVVTHLTGRMGLGLAGVALVALLGNLAAAFAVGWSQGLAPVWSALGGGLAGFGTRLDSWFVGPSRVIPNTINEFPYWSFLFADLHPHLIALPITILVIALVYQLFQGTQQAPDRRKPVSWGHWVLLTLALGALAVTNSWDFPTYTLLLGGALLGRAWRERHRSGRQLAIALARAAIATLVVAVGALLLYLPFFQNFVALVRGIDRVRDGTTLGDYVLLYGLFLAVLVPVVFGATWRLLRHHERVARRARQGKPLGEPSEATPIVGIVAPPAQGNVHRRLRMAVIVTPMLLVVIALTQPALGLKLWLGALILLGLAPLLSRRVSAETWYIVWLAVVAWAVSLGIELVYVRDHLAGGEWYRMNTVFKFGFQVWVLLALATAAALPVLTRGLQRMGLIAEIVGWALFATLMGLALIFPLVGTPSRLAYRFPETTGPTLDGLAFMERASYDWNGNQISLRADGEAIRWLNQHIRGTPVVLQSSLEFYRAYGVRVAANTGLPTVVSPLHENEQRDPSLVAERDTEVQRIYSTPDQGEALRLLSKYHVGYVYVGPIERIAYGQAGTAKFDQMVGAYLELVYSNDAVKIYQVKESVLSIPPLPAVEAPPATGAPAPATESELAALERQVAANPTAAAPAFGLAQRYRDMGRLEQAAAVLEPAIRANPQDIPLHHLWGDILRDLGRYDEAEAAYRAAALAGPTAGNYNKLGAELLKMGRVDRAREALLQAVAIDSSVPEPHFYLGQAYEQQGQNDRALEEYRTYLELAPPDGVFRAQASEAIGRLAGDER